MTKKNCLNKAVITGGAGFIGSHMVELLVSKDFEVTIIDDLANGLQAMSKTQDVGLDNDRLSKVLNSYTDYFDSLLLRYDELVENRVNTINKIMSFLDIKLEEKEKNNIAELTNFDQMKDEAKKNNLGLSHFREGSSNSNRKKLSEYHKIQLRQVIKQAAPDIYENAKELGCANIVYYEED